MQMSPLFFVATLSLTLRSAKSSQCILYNRIWTYLLFCSDPILSVVVSSANVLVIQLSSRLDFAP